MRNVRLIVCPIAALLLVSAVKAHTVSWMENNDGSAPSNPMTLYYPGDVRLGGEIYVRPSSDEKCIVVVTLGTSTSTLVNAQVLPPSTANSVKILVQILRAPSNHTETATITGE